MERYGNASGDSGVFAFDEGADYIIIEFVKGGTYLYTYQSAGRDNIEQMKVLARKGKDLGTFINRNVRHLFEKKLR